MKTRLTKKEFLFFASNIFNRYKQNKYNHINRGYTNIFFSNFKNTLTWQGKKSNIEITFMYSEDLDKYVPTMTDVNNI